MRGRGRALAGALLTRMRAPTQRMPGTRCMQAHRMSNPTWISWPTLTAQCSLRYRLLGSVSCVTAVKARGLLCRAQQALCAESFVCSPLPSTDVQKALCARQLLCAACHDVSSELGSPRLACLCAARRQAPVLRKLSSLLSMRALHACIALCEMESKPPFRRKDVSQVFAPCRACKATRRTKRIKRWC